MGDLLWAANHLVCNLDSSSFLVPTVTSIINCSLTSGQIHPILKEYVISPLLK